MSVDGEGRVFQDFYRMALENVSRIETQKLLTALKRESMAFARGLRWKTEEGWTGRKGGKEGGEEGRSRLQCGYQQDRRTTVLCCPSLLTLGPSFLPSPSLRLFPSLGVPAKAARGNFLEAINVTLNVLEKHHMDRDLTRTGNSILMISPSTGVIEVPPSHA